MKILKNRSKLSTITLVLVLTFASLMAILPSVNAVEHDTAAHIWATPDPVGVGQSVLVTMWLTNVPPQQFPDYRPRYGYWDGFMLTITKPDGTTETQGPFSTFEAGSGYTSITPSQVGTYSFQFTFPGQTIEVGPYAGDYYRPSTSPTVSITVQEEQLERVWETPIPNDYWTAPIYGENREWGKFAGNWLAGENYAPNYMGVNLFTKAPNSAHVLWTKQEMFGGITGLESYYTSTWYTGRRPGEKFGPPIIIGGRLYYNEAPFFGVYGSPSWGGFKCVDLFTGETIWNSNDFGRKAFEGQYITLGQVLYQWSVSQEGVYTYLWETDGSEWTMYDAYSGRWILNITGVPSGDNYFGANGEIIRYRLDNRNNWLSMWNSSKLLLTRIRAIGTAVDWTPVPGVYDYADGIQWNVTLADVAGRQGIRVLDDEVLIATNTFAATDSQPNVIRQDMAYSLKAEDFGRRLWIANRTVFDIRTDIDGFGEGVYVVWNRNSLTWTAYDASTGALMWETERLTTAFGHYTGMLGMAPIAYGKLYTAGYDGRARAYNIQTGELIWEFYAGDSGLETPYGSWPLHGSYTGPHVADGKVFVMNSEHTPMTAIWKGGKVYALDAETGDEIWSVSGTQAEAAPSGIAYGTVVYLNGYDGKVYAFGRGPSELTVSAPMTGVPEGSSVMITGTITDQSPAQLGTPAISDDDQAAWMEYLHMQKPFPSEATGVEVVLETFDPNGNFYEIGRVTSDTEGNYGLMWVPEVPGEYMIVASFLGSESYGSSSATTYLGVDEAPQPTPPDPSPAPMTDTYLAGSTIAIVAAIAIVAILLLRKK
jgi:outer membrane protein assembly factor BamB